MKGKTRNFLNQWIIQAHRNTKTALFNYNRILKAVRLKGEYPEITAQLIEAIALLKVANNILPKLQCLFNDPRSVRIEV